MLWDYLVRHGIFKMKKTWFKLKNDFHSQRSDIKCETQSMLLPRYVRPTHQQLELAITKDTDVTTELQKCDVASAKSCRNDSG